MILFCNCAHYDFIPAATRERVRAALAHRQEVMIVPDLCGLAARKDARLAAASAAQLTIVACHPRAVKWLFHRAGAPLDETRTTIVNMRAKNADEVVALLETGQTAGAADSFTDARDAWVPWFPVIDYDRCVNCRQCVSFCAFGVYAVDSDGAVTVANPENCKTNCPACARMCPQIAIIFPKCPETPIDGADIAPGDVARRARELEGKESAIKDIHAALAQRRAAHLKPPAH